MTPPLRTNIKQRIHTLPYLSHSRIQRYLTCPEQYRLYYVERWRPRYPAAKMIFGGLVHEAIASFLQDGMEPSQSFQKRWEEMREEALNYSGRESWETLAETGKALLHKFRLHVWEQLGTVIAVEKQFSLNLTGLNIPLVGAIDLVAEQEGQITIVDFKTSSQRSTRHDAILSDQLSLYQLAIPEAQKVGLGVLVKTKNPLIEWQMVKRSPGQLMEFVEKTRYVASQIQQGQFYKRPGMWCKWCDFLPICTGDREQVKARLIKEG